MAENPTFIGKRGYRRKSLNWMGVEGDRAGKFV